MSDKFKSIEHEIFFYWCQKQYESEILNMVILEVIWYDTMDILVFFKYNKSLTGITISLSN